MRYFLDFDRTVFDTDAFKRSMSKRPTLLELLRQFDAAAVEFLRHDPNHTRRRKFLRTWGTFLSHGRFTFTPDELRHFLYSDVEPFLHSHTCTIVTYGVRAFITAKVTAALSGLPVTDVVYTSRKKGRTIARLCAAEEGPCTFVDDMHFQLESVSAWCPNVHVIEIRRNKDAGDGRWPVIHSLDELDQQTRYNNSH
ncbi:MAG TPA: hypothetical protein VEA92_03300 [Candidatus Paceibacterota bacterium]|nr:hypothetical protein [Candidatus Paceibacterota bacterium]